MTLRAVKISRQEFTARRRDRRMVVVDLFAVTLGLLLLAATVGAVVVVEPKVPPATWNFAFADEETIYTICAMKSPKSPVCHDRPVPGGLAAQNEFTNVSTTVEVREGHVEPEKGFVGGRNVTSVRITLTWVDDISRADQPESWDRFELEVVPPPDSGLETRVANATSDVGKKDNEMSGTISFVYNITEKPADFNVTAKSFEEALAQATLPVTEGAMGTWTLTVRLLESGDVSGTVPNDACEPLGDGREALPGNVRQQCDTQARQQQVYDSGGKNAGFEVGREDPSNQWPLDFTITHYRVRIS